MVKYARCETGFLDVLTMFGYKIARSSGSLIPLSIQSNHCAVLISSDYTYHLIPYQTPSYLITGICTTMRIKKHHSTLM